MHQRPRRRVYFEPFRNNPENNGVDQIATRPPIDRAAENQFLLLQSAGLWYDKKCKCCALYAGVPINWPVAYLTVTNKRWEGKRVSYRQALPCISFSHHSWISSNDVLCLFKKNKWKWRRPTDASYRLYSHWLTSFNEFSSNELISLIGLYWNKPKNFNYLATP